MESIKVEDLFIWLFILMIGVLNFSYNSYSEKNLRNERARKDQA